MCPVTRRRTPTGYERATQDCTLVSRMRHDIDKADEGERNVFDIFCYLSTSVMYSSSTALNYMAKNNESGKECLSFFVPSLTSVIRKDESDIRSDVFFAFMTNIDDFFKHVCPLHMYSLSLFSSIDLKGNHYPNV